MSNFGSINFRRFTWRRGLGNRCFSSFASAYKKNIVLVDHVPNTLNDLVDSISKVINNHKNKRNDCTQNTSIHKNDRYIYFRIVVRVHIVGNASGNDSIFSILILFFFFIYFLKKKN